MGPRPSRRPQTLLLVLLALACAVLVGLLLPRTGHRPAEIPVEGGRLIELVTGPAARINPLDGNATPAERDLAALIFAGLTRPGPDGRPRPALAESWQTVDDARVFVFRLRSGLLWQDGHPLTVEDVLFTARALSAMGATLDPTLAAVWLGATVTRAGEDAVRVELARSFAALPAFASFGLLPAHRLGDIPPEQLADAPFFRAPIGAGPFRLVKLSSDRALLTRFEGYALGPPWLDSLELRFMTDAVQRDRALARGKAHATLLGPLDAVPASTNVHTAARSAYTAVFLNHRAPLFADPRVRRALALAVDRETLAPRYGGLPTDIPFAPGWWAAGAETPAPPDEAEAARLLMEAGWVRGPDGALRAADRALAFTLVVPDEGARVALAREIAGMWERLGVRVTVAPTAPDALVRDFLIPRTYEAALAGWDPGPDPDPEVAWGGRFAGSPLGNYGDVRDADLDALSAQGRATPDLEQRRTVYHRYARRFREVAPGIILLVATVRYATADEVRGVNLVAVPDPSARFAEVHRWWLGRDGR